MRDVAALILAVLAGVVLVEVFILGPYHRSGK